MKELEELGYSVEEVKKMRKQNKEFKAFCFQLMKEHGNNRKILEKIAELVDLSVSDIVYHAGLYKNEDHIDYNNPFVAEKKKELYMKIGYNEKKQKKIEELLLINVNDIDGLVRFFSKNTDLYKNAINYIGMFTNLYSGDAKNKIQDFKDRLKAFRDYLMEKKRLQRDAENKIISDNINNGAMKMFQDILDNQEVTSFEDVKKVFNLTDYDIQRFNRILRETMYDKNITMFDKVEAKFKENKSLGLNKYTDSIITLLPLIDKGIPIGNSKRAFDIFDCYTYFGSDIDKMVDVIRFKFTNNMPDEKSYYAVNQLKAILLKYKLKSINYYSGNIDIADEEYRKDFIQKSFDEVLEINQKVINERLVRGSGYVVTDSEKKEIFKVMDEYHIPFNEGMYLLATKRLNNGHLELITPDTISNYLEEMNTKRGSK